MLATAGSSSLRRFALYGLCGGCGVTLDFVAYWVLIQAGVWYQLANGIGYAAGTLISFFLNRAITFRVRDAVLRRMTSFVLVAAVGYAISAALLWLLAERLHVHVVVAKLFTLVAVVIVQFSLNSLITFRTRTSDSPAASSA